MQPKEIDWEKITTIIDDHRNQKWGLIPLLQDIQEEFGYIPPESIQTIAQALKLFPSEVQGVISFYAGFSLTPKGKYVLRVCRGTACHVKGGRGILRLIRRDLGLDDGETTPDYQFTLETTACLGACALAPTMMVNRNYFGKLSPPKVAHILGEYGKEKKEGSEDISNEEDEKSLRSTKPSARHHT
ncbi:MAG: NAD(P)H-dependent oxidoreductase subunit E [Thermodesulfobacteriota bacterium]|nr:NAD(P)H-dependent oxidoreductase subunit E [Thermodesulfobacteriota bacterium]